MKKIDFSIISDYLSLYVTLHNDDLTQCTELQQFSFQIKKLHHMSISIFPSRLPCISLIIPACTQYLNQPIIFFPGRSSLPSPELLHLPLMPHQFSLVLCWDVLSLFACVLLMIFKWRMLLLILHYLQAIRSTLYDMSRNPFSRGQW